MRPPCCSYVDANPVLSKMVTASTTNCLGDIGAQLITKRPEDKYQWERTARFTALGFFVIGPLLHNWYSFLARTFAGKAPAMVAAKLLLDRGVVRASLLEVLLAVEDGGAQAALHPLQFTPIMIAIVFSATMASEGKAKQIPAKLRQDWGSTVIANWGLAIPVQAVNFSVVPIQFQVLWIQTFAVLWKIYLSWKAHLKVKRTIPPSAGLATLERK